MTTAAQLAAVVNARAAEAAAFQAMSDIIDAPPPDTTPPDTTIAGPSDSTADTATISFSGSDDRGSVTFEGALDGAQFLPVVSPVSLFGLPVGAHSYAVRAKDAAGNYDPTPAVWNWNVQAVPPPAIVSAVANPTTLPVGGGSSLVTVQATNATVVTLDGTAMNPQGGNVWTATVSLTVSHTYSAVASRSGAPDATASVPITVAVAQQASSWTKLGAGGPNTGQGWWKGLCIGQSRMFLSAGAVPSSWLFDLNTGVWSLANPLFADWWDGGIGTSENYELAHNPDLDCVHKSVGSPNIYKAGGSSTLISTNTSAPHLTLPAGGGKSFLADFHYRINEACTLSGYTTPATANNNVQRKVVAVDDLSITFDVAPSVAKAAGDNIRLNSDENAGPEYGELRFQISGAGAGQWFNDFPAATVTYRPITPAEIAHWNQAGQGNTMSVSDDTYEYWNGALYAFGAFSVGTGPLRKRVGSNPPVTLDQYTPSLVTPNITANANGFTLGIGTLGNYFGTNNSIVLQGWTGAAAANNGVALKILSVSPDLKTITVDKPVVAKAAGDMVYIGLAGAPMFPPMTLSSRDPALRGGIDKRTGTAFMYADYCQLFERNLSLPAGAGWQWIQTTGQRPSVPPPGDGSVGDDWGILAMRDETANCDVLWCGFNATVGTVNMTAIQKTWTNDNTTRAWRLENVPGTLPPAATGVGTNLDYSPGRGKVEMLVSHNGATEVWEFTRGSL